MKSIEGQQAGFFQQLQSAYQSTFGNQQGILSSITNALSPILEGGPGQMGFSAAETAALRGSAINTNAAQFRNASTIAQAQGGGNTGVTTGGQQQLQAQLASNAGQSLSSNLNQINLASAQAGRQNFFNAESGLAGAASLYNPLGFANSATGAGGQAFSEANTNNQASNQVWADLGGLAGGALDAWISAKAK